jgi:phosphoenolpyruvate-protein phosphotransferase
MAALPDPYLSARAADVRAVGDQVLRTLLGADAPRPTGPGVLVAADLTPELAAALDAATVHAVVLAAGSPTSHAAILARARGIPAVVAAGNAVLDLTEGTPLAVDASAGTVTVRPDRDVIAAHERRRADDDRRRASARAAAAAPARTVDGTLIQVACNVGSVADARAGAERGAEGAGLVRTELCFVGRADEPDVDEQEAVYLEIAQALGGRRITLRTLDVGGDKPLAFLPVPHEDNPFLGLRGLRLGLAREQVLRRQLTAVVRVARRTPVSVMFPMVTTVDELRRARALLDEVRTAERASCALQVGIMVEVPAVALNLGAFAGLLDFVSIGTNDLTQYALAAERGNPHVASLADPLEPGVLALIAAAGRAGRGRFSVAVCGEAAADELAVPLLLGLGVDELSVAPEAVPSVKQRVRELDLPDCAALAGSALEAGSAARVRALVRDRLGGGSTG